MVVVIVQLVSVRRAAVGRGGAIYNAVGAKRELLSRVLVYAAAGERAPVPVPRFMAEQAERETDPRQIIARLVEFWHEALPRTAPVFRVIRAAVAADLEAAALENTRAAQRLRNYERAAQTIAERGGLRAGLTVEPGAATIFAIGHPDTYRALVIDRNWTGARWAHWAQRALEGALIPTAARQRAGGPRRHSTIAPVARRDVAASELSAAAAA